MIEDDLLFKKMDEYSEAFDDSFPRMMMQNATDEEVVRIIDECLKSGKPVGVELEPGVVY